MKTISSLDFKDLCVELKPHSFYEHKIALKTPCNTLLICAKQEYGYIIQIKQLKERFTNLKISKYI